MKKRLLALLLAVVMIAGMIPTIAAANPVPLMIRPDTTPRATYTFYAGGREVVKQIVKNGDKLTEPAAPTGEGKFLGWYVEGAEKPLDFTQAVTVSETGTVKVFAHFDEVQYVLFMDENKERVVDCKTLREGDTVQTSGVTFPVDADQAITGWVDEHDNPVTQVTYGQKIYVVYAVVSNGYWLTFNTNGGSYIAPQFFTDTPDEPTTNPTKPGYTFGGWYTDEACEDKADFSGITGTCTVYANWIPKNSVTYTVLHMQENADDDGYSTKDLETKSGQAGLDTNAQPMSYPGFKAQAITQQTINGDGSTIVTVYYKRDVYEVKFYYYDSFLLWGEWKEYEEYRITAKYGANISDNWPGGGWYVSKDPNDSTAQSGIDTMPLKGKNFYGKQNGTSAKAYYYLEVLPGETGTQVGSKYYTLDHTDSAPAGLYVTKEDRYPITGFTCNESISTKNGQAYDGAKFYYDRNSYNLIFISGGKEVNTASVKYGASISGYASYAPSTPPEGKDGYVFDGWYDNELGVGDAYDFTGKTMPAQNITLYAKWVAPVHTVTFWQDNTKLGEITDIPHGSTITEGQAPTVNVGEKEEFYGWTLRDGTPFNFNTEIRNNYDLFAKVGSKEGYKLTYSVDGDETLVKDDYHYAKDTDAVVKNYKFTDTDKVFLGWDTSDAGTTVVYKPGETIKMTADTTLYAVFGPKTGTVSLTYHSNFGATDKTQTVSGIANNGLVTVKTYAETGLPTREGYSFLGWRTTRDGTVEYKEGAFAVIDNDGSNDLYAVWQINSYEYTVEYYIDGTKNDSMTVTGSADFGTVIDSYTDKCPTGYKFEKHENFPLTISTDASANVIKVYYIKDDSQTQPTKYTVKYTIAGVEQTEDKLEVTGTAWINDNPAQIAIAAGGIPAPANKYTGYKLDPANPEYPAAGTLVNSGKVFVVNYIKKENPTPATFDPDDIDGDGTVLAKKELIVLRGSAPEETFEVAIKDRVTGATMLTGEVTFSGRSGEKAFYFGRTLEFYYAGTYTYTISEAEGNTRWMTYDDSVYELEIVVKLNEEQNKLYVDSVNLYGWSNPSIVFTNTYDRKTGTVVIPTTPSQLNTDDHYAYVIGYPDGSVHPNGEITRAEVAAIFFRLLRDDVRSANFTTYNAYTDVSADKWYNNPISTMSRLGIIKGYPDGTFRPNDPITRAEFAAIAARFDEHKAAKLASFTDIYGHWAVSEISLAYENGWIKGYNDGTFRPNRNITRAEAMALINRVLNRAPEKPSDLLNNMNKWTDNLDTTKWYYLDVQEATNSHDYTRKTNNYEMWKKMLADPDWAKYER